MIVEYWGIRRSQRSWIRRTHFFEESCNNMSTQKNTKYSTSEKNIVSIDSDKHEKKY